MKLSDKFFLSVFTVMFFAMMYKFLFVDYTIPQIKKNDIVICNYNDRQYTAVVENISAKYVYFHNKKIPIEYCKKKVF